MLVVTEIQSWLLDSKPKVCKFVCFVSSVVGLLCYGLSSSFNDLFGKWNLWKLLLYIVFSFGVSLTVVSLAKAWESSSSSSSSPRLKAHTTFLALLTTCLYSFYFDKQVKAKPDAYSLVSCAAFAIMSLGLSTISHFGFEVDLLYFFNEFLIIQLVKIKLWLVIVGGSFCYSLLILRSTLNSPPRHGFNGLHHLDLDDVVIEIGSHSHSQGTSDGVSQEAIITGTVNVHPQADDTLLENEHEDLRLLVTQVGSPLEHEGCSDIRSHFMGCIEALKKENWNVIHMIFKHVHEYLKVSLVDKDQISLVQLLHPDDNLVVDSLPSGIINDLRESSRLMVTAGLKDECFDLYTSCRREFLNMVMSTLATQKLDMEDSNNMEKIQCWIEALGLAEGIVFPNERRLVERIFEGSIPSKDMLKHSLFRIKDVLRLRRRFWIFGELLYLTYGDKKQYTVPYGRVHPITRDVLAYIDMICGNRKGLEGTMFDLEVFSPTVLLATIIDLLDTFLEANSKLYDNLTLGYLFIINNWRYVEIGAQRRGLESILGEDWLQKITTKFKQNLQQYHRSSWNKIVGFLKLGDINETKPIVVAELLKDKLHSFNEHLHEICNVQSTWFIFDEQLREQIIKSIENILLPAYGNFIGRFQDFHGKHAYEYIKYGMFDIQEPLNKLFLIRE